MKRLLVALILLACLMPVVSADADAYNSSLILLLHMNQSPANPTYFNDSSASGTIATTFGGATTNTTTKYFGNSSGFFDGVGDYVGLPASSATAFGTANFTIMYWIYPNSYPEPKMYMDSRDTDVDTNSLVIYAAATSGNVTYYVNGASRITGTPVSTNVWHQVVISRLSGSTKMYVDGIQNGSTYVDAINYAQTNTTKIGRYYKDEGNNYIGNLDEVAIWKNQTAETPQISDLYPQLKEIWGGEAITPVAEFHADDTTPEIGQTVLFIDDSSNLPDTWNWTFGESPTDYSSNQNPGKVYSAIGSYNVSLWANNTAGGDWENKTYYITVHNVTGLSPEDIWMEGEYLQTFHITDSATGLPIAAVDLQDSLMQTFTTTNGTGYLTEPFGASTVVFTSTGYTSKPISYVFDSDASHDVQLTVAPTPPSQNSNTLWTPHQVVFQCLDGNNNPIINTPISALAVYTTLPGGMANAVAMVQSAYGLQESAAIQLINTTTAMSGLTDRTGSAVFVMLPVIDYAVTFRDATGINYTTSIMPQDSYYQLNTPNATYQSQANLELAYIRNMNASIFNTTYSQTANGTLGTMGMHIYDSTGQTAGANCWWTLIDNSTTWWDNRTWALGSGLQTFGKTVVTTPYQQWKWGCTTL